jgi:hypothetical protein
MSGGLGVGDGCTEDFNPAGTRPPAPPATLSRHRGQYANVWRNGSEGRWRVVLNIGDTPPEP